jgi:hypothetical protein
MVTANHCLLVAGAPLGRLTLACRPSSPFAALDPLIYPDAGELLPFICTSLMPRLNGEIIPIPRTPHHTHGKAPQQQSPVLTGARG